MTSLIKYTIVKVYVHILRFLYIRFKTTCVLNINFVHSCLEPVEHRYHGNCDDVNKNVGGSMNLIIDVIGLDFLHPIHLCFL